MERNIFLAGRIREVYLDGTWVANTNLKDQLSKVSWQEAVRKEKTLNTIAAITFHLNYYLDGLLTAFETGNLEIRDKFSFNVPPIQSEKAWNQLKNEVINNAVKFADKVASMDDQAFDAPFIDEKYGSFLRNIEGVIEHSYYHLGQISLIRKLFTQ